MNKKEIISAILLLLIIPTITLYDAYESSNINDELYYITNGYAILKEGNFNLLIMPGLVSEIAALPLLFINPTIPSYIENKKVNPFSRELFYQTQGNDAQQMLFWSRTMMILVSMIFGFFVFKWAYELYGVRSGFLALLLYVFSVQILGVSNRVLLDLTLSLFIFLSIYWFWRFSENPTKKNAIITGVMFGLALASKSSSILIVPIFLIITFFTMKNNKEITMKVMSISFLIIALTGAVVLFATYGFNIEPLTVGERETLWLDNTIDSVPLKTFLISAIDIVGVIPIPFTQYIKSLGFQLIHSGTGHGTFFLMGEYSTTGWWNFYTTTLFFKLQIPLLILLFASLITYQKDKNTPYLAVPILFYLIYFSFFVKINLGIHYIFPILAFLFVFASRIASITFPNKKIIWVGLSILIIWYAVSAILIAPFFNSYFNEFAGGPNNGHNIMVDFDCGQHLPRLKQYMDKNHIKEVKGVYTGTADPYYYEIKFEHLYQPVGLEYWNKEHFNHKKTCKPQTGTYVIPTRVLQNFQPDKDCFKWLRDTEPDAIIGHCFFIYTITERDLDDYTYD